MIRILVAFEDDYRAYADALARAIKAHRPRLEVVTLCLEALRTEVARLDPQLIIGSSLDPLVESEDEDGRPLLLAWVELSVDPHRPSKFCLNGWRWESLNPSLEELLGLIDEIEQQLVRSSQREEKAC